MCARATCCRCPSAGDSQAAQNGCCQRAVRTTIEPHSGWALTCLTTTRALPVLHVHHAHTPWHPSGTVQPQDMTTASHAAHTRQVSAAPAACAGSGGDGHFRRFLLPPLALLGRAPPSAAPTSSAAALLRHPPLTLLHALPPPADSPACTAAPPAPPPPRAPVSAASLATIVSANLAAPAAPACPPWADCTQPRCLESFSGIGMFFGLTQ